MFPQTPEVVRVIKPFTGQAGGYVSVFPDANSQDKLVSWANTLDFWLDHKQVGQLHCTVMCSRVFSPTYDETEPEKVLTARVVNFEYWDGSDFAGYIVAVLQSRDLKERHAQWLDRGAKHSFEDYLPHVTLATGVWGTPALIKRTQRLSDKYRGSILRFSGECLQDQSTS